MSRIDVECHNNEGGWTTVARSKETKHELRRIAEQQAAKRAKKQEKRAAARARSMAEQLPCSEPARTEENRYSAANTSVSPLAAIPLDLIARVCMLSDIVRDVKVYLVNRAASSDNAKFTVRNLCESRDLYYKRDVIIKVLQDLLSNGFIRLASSDGEELFCITEKMWTEVCCARAQFSQAPASASRTPVVQSLASQSAFVTPAPSVAT
jgi:hypothetical protein